jgi:hypothetical protein
MPTIEPGATAGTSVQGMDDLDVSVEVLHQIRAHVDAARMEWEGQLRELEDQRLEGVVRDNPVARDPGAGRIWETILRWRAPTAAAEQQGPRP